jgi:hypothetical protein
MPNARFGDLGDADKAVQRFVLESLEVTVLRPDSPPTINIDVEFSRFLVTHGVEELVATEVAEEQRSLVRRKVQEYIGRWSGQGVLTPLNFIVESDEVVISWSHERFAELTGGDAPGREFVAVYEWLGAQTNRDFLLPCLCFLKLLGCDPIFVTDSPRDEGVDCIGIIDNGGLRSTAIFIQARSKNELISGDALLQEYAKYSALPRTEKYMKYLTALGVPKRQDGTGFLYAVLTNADFKFAAQNNATRLGVLLRSRRQLAQSLSLHTGRTKLEHLKAQLKLPDAGDLTTNFAPRLVL